MRRNWIILLLAVLLAFGCASTRPFAYHDSKDEKQGPGLFSGEEGGYVIHGGDSQKKPPDSEKTDGAD
jgi:hypothetical protein